MKRLLGTIAGLLLVGSPLVNASPSSDEIVTLPLAQYLDLVAQGRAAAEAANQRSKPAAHELVAQRVRVRLDGDLAHCETTFELVTRGDGAPPLPLPVPGWVEEGTVSPAGAAVLARSPSGNELYLVSASAGKAQVRLVTRANLQGTGETLTLPTFATPALGAGVVELWLDLPAELAWEFPQAVVLDQQVNAGRRQLTLAPERGSNGVLSLRRQGSQPAAPQTAVARAVVVTHLDLRAEDLLRLDTVLIEVLRGELATLSVLLPPGGLGGDIERAWMDDGGEVIVGSNGVEARRKGRLTGRGYLKILSRRSAAPSGRVALAPLQPDVPVRARYLVVSAAVAATLSPQPEAAWSAIDLTDPPDALAAELAERPPAAGWRLEGDAASAALAIGLLPRVARATTPILGRETTTLVNTDGSLLIQDHFRLGPSRTSLVLTFPPGTQFESAVVDGDVVRPIERNGQHRLPMPDHDGVRERWVVVSYTDRPLPAVKTAAKRPESRRLVLPKVEGEVLMHRWNLHLPPGVEARWVAGTLRRVSLPPPPPPPKRTPARGRRDLSDRREARENKDASNTSSVNEDELQRVPEAPVEAAPAPSTDGSVDSVVGVEEMQLQSNFAFGGTAIEVRLPTLGPLPGGTSWLLAGALPAAEVALELEVKVIKPKRGR